MLKRDYAGLLYETRNLIICVAVLLVNIIAVTVYALYASMAVSKVYEFRRIINRVDCVIGYHGGRHCFDKVRA